MDPTENSEYKKYKALLKDQSRVKRLRMVERNTILKAIYYAIYINSFNYFIANIQ